MAPSKVDACVCAAHVGIIILCKCFKEGMLGLQCSRTIDKVYNSDKCSVVREYSCVYHSKGQFQCIFCILLCTSALLLLDKVDKKSKNINKNAIVMMISMTVYVRLTF